MKQLIGNIENTSPYTQKTIDGAISHLERVVSSEWATSLFPKTYWYGRALQAYTTPGLTQTQQERLQRLLHLIATA